MDKYTTAALVEADKTGKEAKKVVLEKDTFAIVDMLDSLIKQLEANRITYI